LKKSSLAPKVAHDRRRRGVPSKQPRLIRERVRDFRIGSWRPARGTFLVQTGSKHAYYPFETQGASDTRRQAPSTSPSVRQRSKLLVRVLIHSTHLGMGENRTLTQRWTFGAVFARKQPIRRIRRGAILTDNVTI